MHNSVAIWTFFAFIALLIALMMFIPFLAKSQKLLVPEDFEVPQVLETENFRLRKLTAADAEKDYEAVMETAERLRSQNGGTWPREGFTLEENRADLRRHESEFDERKAFVYTVVSLDESRVLGCVYFYPSRDPDYDLIVYLWARQSEYEKGMEDELERVVRDWLDRDWPFENPGFSGRE